MRGDALLNFDGNDTNSCMAGILVSFNNSI